VREEGGRERERERERERDRIATYWFNPQLYVSFLNLHVQVTSDVFDWMI